MRYRAMPGIMLLVACASTIGFAAQPEILVPQVAAADNGYTPVRDHGLVVHAMVKAVELGQVERLAGGVDCLQAPVQGIRTFAQ